LRTFFIFFVITSSLFFVIKQNYVIIKYLIYFCVKYFVLISSEKYVQKISFRKKIEIFGDNIDSDHSPLKKMQESGPVLEVVSKILYKL